MHIVVNMELALLSIWSRVMLTRKEQRTDVERGVSYPMTNRHRLLGTILAVAKEKYPFAPVVYGKRNTGWSTENRRRLR